MSLNQKSAGTTLRLTLAVLLLIIATSHAYALPRLAVRRFDNKTDVNAPADAITDMMTTELGYARIFSLMERENLDYVTDEIRLGQSGYMDRSTAPKVGKIKGAQYTMTGAITQYGFNKGGAAVGLRHIGVGGGTKTAYVTLDIRIIDNTTGEIVYVNSTQGSAKRSGGGAVAYYRGFAVGGYGAEYGGILAEATRDAVIKQVNEMKQYDWEY